MKAAFAWLCIIISSSISPCTKKNRLTPEKTTRRYVQGIPPYLVVEVEVEPEGTSLQSAEEFALLKTGKLIEFGMQKIIWILTKNLKK